MNVAITHVIRFCHRTYYWCRILTCALISLSCLVSSLSSADLFLAVLCWVSAVKTGSPMWNRAHRGGLIWYLNLNRHGWLLPAAQLGRSTKSGKWVGCNHHLEAVEAEWRECISPLAIWYTQPACCCRSKALELQPPCWRASIRPRQMHLEELRTYTSTCRAHVSPSTGHSAQPHGFTSSSHSNCHHIIHPDSLVS